MLRPGLVSVTFRSLRPAEIVHQSHKHGLQGIEWGGDVHVPPGDIQNAREVRRLTRESGLEVVCYGSYYRCTDHEKYPFETVLETALALEAPVIRVWAGDEPSEGMDPLKRQDITEDLHRVTTMAAGQNVQIATEYHGNTLTDTLESWARLQADARHPNLLSLWQPLLRSKGDEQTEANAAELQAVLPHHAHTHCYEWHETADGRVAQSLAGSRQWPAYLEILAASRPDSWVLLEFLPREDEENLKKEAEALLSMLKQARSMV